MRLLAYSRLDLNGRELEVPLFGVQTKKQRLLLGLTSFFAPERSRCFLMEIPNSSGFDLSERIFRNRGRFRALK
jgi:hypothetical protein